MSLIADTGAREQSPDAPTDHQHTGDGSASAPGGGAAPARSTQDMTHGQEGYPGSRAAGEADKPNAPSSAHDPSQNNADTPVGGDTDPDSTASADETGQAGVNDRPGKDKAHPWNG